MPNNSPAPRFAPDFSRMLKVLRCEKPARPVLFELLMNGPVLERMAGRVAADPSALEGYKLSVDAFLAGGYDYATVLAGDFYFPSEERSRKSTITLNEGFVITDEAGYEAYAWPEPDDCDFSPLKDIAAYMPEGMKLMVMSPDGVLENVTKLMGYDNLCYAIYEQPELVRAVFDQVGSRLLRYYANALEFDTVGMLMSNDDWGFRTQTFLSVEHMREYVFPWHKKIAELGHSKRRPVLLHSCGYMADIFEDIIGDMGFDGKHSYEDTIIPVEESYERWGGRVAILGGIDMDFLVRAEIPDIKARCRAMLDLAEGKGGYALGSGNSIPEYVPHEKYIAMLETAWERR